MSDSVACSVKECVVHVLPKYMVGILSGATFGGALYINMVEHPARMAVAGGPSNSLENWLATFPRAMMQGRSLGALSAAACVASYFLCKPERDVRYLLVGAVQMGILPYTIAFIAPTNEALLDTKSSRAKPDDWKTSMLEKWNCRHAVRTILTGASLVLLLSIFDKK